MTKGTEPTPPQLRLKLSEWGADNALEANRQLRRQGVPVADIVKFEETVRASLAGGYPGQMHHFNKGAEAIGAEIHWV